MNCRCCNKELTQLDYTSFQIHKGIVKPDEITELNHICERSHETHIHYNCKHCGFVLAGNREEARQLFIKKSEVKISPRVQTWPGGGIAFF